MKKPAALEVILDEHNALSVLLQSMSLLVKQGPGNNPGAFFDGLRAMLFYIDEFPERLHHPKETDLLFPKVAALAPETREAIDKLDRDHSKGTTAVLELQHLLLGWQLMGDVRQKRFIDALTRYLAFYREHMELEEKVILPMALKVLTTVDWNDLDAAFQENRDALTGKYPAKEEYKHLFSHIARVAPAPIGMGG